MQLTNQLLYTSPSQFHLHVLHGGIARCRRRCRVLEDLLFIYLAWRWCTLNVPLLVYITDLDSAVITDLVSSRHLCSLFLSYFFLIFFTILFIHSNSCFFFSFIFFTLYFSLLLSIFVRRNELLQEVF